MVVDLFNPDDWLKTLQVHGGRVSKVQILLVRIFLEAQSPLSAEQIWQIAQSIRPETCRATVYRTVER